MRSSQLSLERWKVAGDCGSGMSAGFQPKAANSFLRPAETSLPSSRVVVGEELEGRRGGPLFALEKHGDEGRGEDEGGSDFGAAGG